MTFICKLDPYSLEIYLMYGVRVMVRVVSINRFSNDQTAVASGTCPRTKSAEWNISHIQSRVALCPWQYINSVWLRLLLFFRLRVFSPTCKKPRQDTLRDGLDRSHPQEAKKVD